MVISQKCFFSNNLLVYNEFFNYLFQDGLYESVGKRELTNYMRGAWKRSIASQSKARCRHLGCTFETEDVEDIMEHYVNCPNAPKTVFTAFTYRKY